MARSHFSIARRANMSASNITRFFSNADFDVSGVRKTTSAALSFSNDDQAANSSAAHRDA